MELKLDLLKLEEIDNENIYYENLIKSHLKKIIPDSFLFNDYLIEENIKKFSLFLNEQLPIIKWSELDQNSSFSITLFCKYRQNASSFFYDMVSRYLIFQKTLDISLFFSIDFKFSDISDEKFSIIEAKINIEKEDADQIINNKKAIETEIRLGMLSDYHANRIREFKGLSYDRKTAMVQDKIGSLIQKRPKEFEKNIFSEMQQFLIMSRDEFKSQRDYHHISRIISILYMIRKLLKQNIKNFPNKRHVILKFLKTKLKTNSEEQNVLGVLIGINFVKEHEIFEKRHLIKAITTYMPNVNIIEDSYFVDKLEKTFIQTCYLEIQKKDLSDFSKNEIEDLKNELPAYLKSNVEHLIHQLFMPRNEEEIVKNMVMLSHQLKYIHDIPQVIISFDKQTSAELIFNVVLLRVLKPSDIPLKEIILKVEPNIKFVIEREKKVGVIRRKYLKEANVFRAILDSSKYLRSDHTLDTNKARSDIVDELNRLFSEVRDYNGGMIFKQNEAFKKLKGLLGKLDEHNDLFLEKFFYSIIPVEMTAIVNLEILKNLFLMLVNAVKREETRIKKHSDFLFKQDFKNIYFIIPIYDQKKKKEIKEAVECINVLSSECMSFYLSSHDVYYLGYVLMSEDKIKQKAFFDVIKKSLNSLT